MQIRALRPSDMKSLLELDRECFSSPFRYSKSVFKEFLSKKGVMSLVAEDNGQIEGFIIFKKTSAIGHIITIDVKKCYRRTGIGFRLLEEAHNRIAGLGGKQVGIEVWQGNLGGIDFFTGNGYEYVGTIRNYYAKGKNALVMRKHINFRMSPVL